jgi:hypothetical protein
MSSCGRGRLEGLAGHQSETMDEGKTAKADDQVPDQTRCAVSRAIPREAVRTDSVHVHLPISPEASEACSLSARALNRDRWEITIPGLRTVLRAHTQSHVTFGRCPKWRPERGSLRWSARIAVPRPGVAAVEQYAESGGLSGLQRSLPGTCGRACPRRRARPRTFATCPAPQAGDD